MKKVLAINSGSSSFKFKLFSLPSNEVIAEGMADRVGLPDSTFTIKLSDGEKHEIREDIPTQEDAVQKLLDLLQEYHVVESINEIAGVGHRIVAGGEYFKESTIITKDNLQKIFDLKDYAPLHNPAEGKGIEAFMKILPGVPQVGVFDSAFHQSLDPVHYLYPVPYKYYEKYKARKYGAHGTSVRYVSNEAAKMLGKDLKNLKLIVCHLGSGASITAVKDGKSYDTSMGFSPLDGIEMATRSGSVDPSLLQYVMHKENLDIDQMIDILNNKSGLDGVSGISPDMRDLRKSDSERAKIARDIYINRVVRTVGAYMAEMKGMDALIFTAGVGEHDNDLRKRVMEYFEFVGLKPDLQANETNGQKFISQSDSKIKAMIIPTNEELMIEEDVVRLAGLE
ncbi:acetate kinase [Lactobacillus rodentium]|uniref:Acetate kinase n=1 Tax=Lactobacillus rodentium TaxID=947835 RepID=A0A2Z6T7F4_9LACO|nr:acetate kinase [Lactobacillus rodentium]MCR1894295.1 acetate kinase [Lactobacillus rodentium]GBG04591.1 acetate kinase [Lactobacillus rodentium]